MRVEAVNGEWQRMVVGRPWLRSAVFEPPPLVLGGSRPLPTPGRARRPGPSAAVYDAIRLRVVVTWPRRGRARGHVACRSIDNRQRVAPVQCVKKNRISITHPSAVSFVRRGLAPSASALASARCVCVWSRGHRLRGVIRWARDRMADAFKRDVFLLLL